MTTKSPMTGCGQPKTNPDLAARVLVVRCQRRSEGSGNGPDAGAHQADAVEIGLFPGALFSPLAGLVALVEELDFLQFIERFAQ